MHDYRTCRSSSSSSAFCLSHSMRLRSILVRCFHGIPISDDRVSPCTGPVGSARGSGWRGERSLLRGDRLLVAMMSLIGGTSAALGACRWKLREFASVVGCVCNCCVCCFSVVCFCVRSVYVNGFRSRVDELQEKCTKFFSFFINRNDYYF